jgi:hypothetical protein
MQVGVSLSQGNHEATGPSTNIEYSSDIRKIVIVSSANRRGQRVRMHPRRDVASLFHGDLPGSPRIDGPAPTRNARGA